MAVPDSLPQRAYLLAHDPDKGRMRIGTHLGAVLRAAALADLHVHGHLTEERNRAVVTGDGPVHDPVLRSVLDEIAASRRPRKWQNWVSRRQGPIAKAVRQQLGDDGWVRLQPHRILGIFPTTKVTARDPRVRKEILARVHAALKDPIARVDPVDAALVAIVTAGGLTLVLDRKAKRAHKRRIEELTGLSGPVGPALRKSIQAAMASEGAAG